MSARDLSIHAPDREAVRAELADVAARDAAELALMANGGQAVAEAPLAAASVAAAPEPEPAPAFAAVVYDYTPADITVRLLNPFFFDGARVASIDVRPPRFDHVEAYFAKRISRMALFAEMTGVAEAGLAALRWADSERVIAACHALCPDLG